MAFGLALGALQAMSSNSARDGFYIALWLWRFRMIAGALHQITYLQAFIISFVLVDTGVAVVSLSVRASTLPLWTGHPRMRLQQEVAVSCKVAVDFQLAAGLRTNIQTPVLEGGA